jgi:hypothetical protein
MIKLSHSKQQKITPAEIENFETKYKYKLPQNYKDLMLECNGGHPERRYFNETRVYFTPIKYGAVTMENLLDVTDNELLPVGYFPFAQGGESMFCFDTTKSDSKIYRIDEDGEIEEVSNSFEDFIDALEDDED